MGFKLSDLDLEMISHIPPGGNWQNISETTMKKSQRLMQIAKSGGRTTLYGRINYESLLIPSPPILIVQVMELMFTQNLKE
jgi:hypothetical protein